MLENLKNRLFYRMLRILSINYERLLNGTKLRLTSSPCVDIECVFRVGNERVLHISERRESPITTWSILIQFGYDSVCFALYWPCYWLPFIRSFVDISHIHTHHIYIPRFHLLYRLPDKQIIASQLCDIDVVDTGNCAKDWWVGAKRCGLLKMRKGNNVSRRLTKAIDR